MYFTYCIMFIISTLKLGNNANSQDGIDDGSGVIQQVSTKFVDCFKLQLKEYS